MCSPSAIGSRQARATIWARCRGGNLLRTSQAGLVQQEFLQAALLVTAADTPDRGSVTLQARGHRLDGLSGGHGEHDAGVLNLEEGQVAATRHSSQDRSICDSDGQGTRLSATHGNTFGR
jgi:hypothetical protein